MWNEEVWLKKWRRKEKPLDVKEEGKINNDNAAYQQGQNPIMLIALCYRGRE